MNKLSTKYPKFEVSIIIPVYNRESLLKNTLRTIMQQDFQDFEVIIVNDGSHDRSVDICNSFIQRYPQRIKLISTKHQGVSIARNKGITVCSGEYIAFCDSDDLWIKSKLKKQITYMKKNSINVCQTEEIWIRNGNHVNPMKKHKKYNGWIFYYCLPLCIVSPSAVVIKREVFEKVGLFDPKLPVAEDYDLWLRISLKYPIILFNKPLIYKTGGHPDQLSRKYWGMDRYRVHSLISISKKHSKQMSVFKKLAVWWWIAYKSKIIYQGAYKRKNIWLFIKYLAISFWYKLKWNITYH